MADRYKVLGQLYADPGATWYKLYQVPPPMDPVNTTTLAGANIVQTLVSKIIVCAPDAGTAFTITVEPDQDFNAAGPFTPAADTAMYFLTAIASAETIVLTPGLVLPGDQGDQTGEETAAIFVQNSALGSGQICVTALGVEVTKNE